MSYYPSVIARPTSTGFAGRRVHTGNRPEYAIELLLRLHRDAFSGNLEVMQKFLINDHPGGWSQLGGDPTVDTGWDNKRQFRDGFICYCHGGRHEAYSPFTQDSDATEVEWLYVLDATGITVSQADWSDSEDDDETPPVWRRRWRISWHPSAALDNTQTTPISA